ncbi:hypothetical protein CC78DRAFT_367649 [Lojkania enalia]|uniref:Vacuolar sorting-associated protein n=1 Tax=Lojkania enalia TaxID=147567 RepID=A0A9P4N883_9PLEO|nr:hypothetical protein CC78DRAFT_367649 [Didymosphaeria enalia]
MPVVPYLQNVDGGGQVPLRGITPALPPFTASSILPTSPTYPLAAVYLQTHNAVPTFAPDASSLEDPRPTIDIPIEHSSHDTAAGQVPASFVSVGGPLNDSDIQMKVPKPAIAAAGTLLCLFSFSQLYQKVLFSRITPGSERAEEESWVSSSNSWLDRSVCNWFGICGIAHLNKAGWTGPKLKSKYRKQEKPLSLGAGQIDKIDLKAFWSDVANYTNPYDWSTEERRLREIPKYVLDHAPYVHLYSGEEFWPCDIAEHLIHTTPHLNYTPLQATSDHPNLTNLDELNEWGRFVYLQSDDNVEDRPEWLGGEINIPDVPDDSDSNNNWANWDDKSDGKFTKGKKVDTDAEAWWDAGIGDTKDKGGIRPAPTTSPPAIPTDTAEGEELVEDYQIWQPELLRRRMGKQVVGGRSDAPAVLIVIDKGEGVVDAFWFFFYSYNLGNAVFNVRFGNHVGDWEHTVVRFHHGEPKAVFFSEHSFGEAYTFDAIEKIGNRPVGYSATGTHAMYATPGTHPYVLPGGILHDVTDRGPLWDPLLNVYAFTYDYQTDILRASNVTPDAPTGWFYFMGHWGDKFYPLSDPRQYRFLGQYHYVNGPLGPRFKNLGRKEICQGNGECLLKSWTGPKRWTSRVKRFRGVGEGEEMSEEDVRRFVGPEQETTS